MCNFGTNLSFFNKKFNIGKYSDLKDLWHHLVVKTSYST